MNDSSSAANMGGLATQNTESSNPPEVPETCFCKLGRRFGDEFHAWASWAASSMPGRLGIEARRRYFRTRLRRLGASSIMGIGIEFVEPSRISIGERFISLRNCFLGASEGGRIDLADDVSLASNVTLDAGTRGLIRIGAGSGVAHNSVLRASKHNYADAARPFKSQGHKSGSIIIEDDVWVAANCIVLPDTHIEKGCIIASGSMVGGHIKAYSIIAGNPGRVIGRRE